MSEAQRRVQQFAATVVAAVVREYQSSLDALARDTAYHVAAGGFGAGVARVIAVTCPSLEGVVGTRFR